MPKISEAEARALLSRPLRCEGDFAWALKKVEPPGKVLSAGVVDEAGRGTHMAVDLKYMCAPSMTATTFPLTLS